MTPAFCEIRTQFCNLSLVVKPVKVDENSNTNYFSSSKAKIPE